MDRDGRVGKQISKVGTNYQIYLPKQFIRTSRTECLSRSHMPHPRTYYHPIAPVLLIRMYTDAPKLKILRYIDLIFLLLANLT